MSHKIEISLLTDTITIEGKQYLLCPKDKLEQLLDDNITMRKENSEYKADIEELRKVIMAILDVLGILDPKTGTVKETIKNGEESYIKNIGKALTGLLPLLMGSGFGSSNKKKLEEKFAFIKNIIPIAQKYAGK